MIVWFISVRFSLGFGVVRVESESFFILIMFTFVSLIKMLSARLYEVSRLKHLQNAVFCFQWCAWWEEMLPSALSLLSLVFCSDHSQASKSRHAYMKLSHGYSPVLRLEAYWWPRMTAESHSSWDLKSVSLVWLPANRQCPKAKVPLQKILVIIKWA